MRRFQKRSLSYLKGSFVVFTCAQTTGRIDPHAAAALFCGKAAFEALYSSC